MVRTSPSSWNPQPAWHVPAVLAVRIAESRAQVPLFAMDHTDVYDDECGDDYGNRPPGADGQRDPAAQQGLAEVIRVPRPSEWARADQVCRCAPCRNRCAGLAKRPGDPRAEGEPACHQEARRGQAGAQRDRRDAARDGRVHADADHECRREDHRRRHDAGGGVRSITRHCPTTLRPRLTPRRLRLRRIVGMLPPGPASSPLVRSIVGGSILVGVLDFADAVAFNAMMGVGPLRVAQSIASGLMGRAAYEGGWGTAVLGVCLHFVIATIVTSVFVAAAGAWPSLRRRPFVWGPLYGLLVFLMMYRVVLPIVGLNAWPRRWPAFLNAVGAHIFAVGLPVALWDRRAWSPHEADVSGS